MKVMKTDLINKAMEDLADLKNDLFFLWLDNNSNSELKEAIDRRKLLSVKEGEKGK